MVEKKEELEEWQEESIIMRQNLEDVDQGVRGGIFGSGQPARKYMNSVVEEIPDAVANPLPHPQGALPLHNQDLPKLVSNSSGDVDDQDPELWSPDDATLLTRLKYVDTSATKSVDEPAAEDPYVENMQAKRKVFASLLLIL